MTDKYWCVIDGQTTSDAFSVKISLTATVDDLKEAIKNKKTNSLSNIDADELSLWQWSILPDADDGETSIEVKDLDKDAELRHPKAPLSSLSIDDNTYIIVQLPQPDPQKRALEIQELPKNMRVRMTEGWKQYTASDGKVVDLPQTLIDILARTEYVPAPRTAFDHLKNDLRAGDEITIPSMGQIPKDFGLPGQGRRLFVTEQMLGLWEDMRGDKDRTYRRVLSGPMGIGKSYLSFFLAASAYAEGWLVLYISDAKVLKTDYEEQADTAVVERFLSLNKDILTGAELEMLVNKYDGTRDISRDAVWVIFRNLLKSRDRKTLLLVDEHGKLFEKKPYVPDKFMSLVWLSSYGIWEEESNGSRVVFTGTAHAKYEIEIMDESYRPTSVVFVGPLSETVFLKLLETYPRLNQPEIKDEIKAITNCVPRELVYLSVATKSLDLISVDDLQKWERDRTKELHLVAETYHNSRDPYGKKELYKALLHTFLGSTDTVEFESDFLDLGLVYRSKDPRQVGTQYRILCRPAQKALLKQFTMFSLPEDIKKRIHDGSLDGDDFEMALWHQLICTTKPILLNATDLNGQNPTTISLDFSHCHTIRGGDISLGLGYENVLARGYKGYPRFDFMPGPLLIQASISEFGNHNKGSADIHKAFDDRDDDGANQIERYLNDAFGPGHSAKICDDSRFKVTRNGVPVPGFHIVYIHGTGGKPAHREWVKKLPDVLHVSFEVLQDKLFKNIV